MENLETSISNSAELQYSNSTLFSGGLNSVFDETSTTVYNSSGNIAVTTQSPEIQHLGGIAYGVVAPIIVVFGIVSNLLNLLVLTRPSLRSPTFR